MGYQGDMLGPWKWGILLVSTVVAFEFYKRRKGRVMTGGEKLGYGTLSLLAGCGFVIVLELVLFCIRMFVGAVFGST